MGKGVFFFFLFTCHSVCLHYKDLGTAESNKFRLRSTSKCLLPLYIQIIYEIYVVPTWSQRYSHRMDKNHIYFEHDFCIWGGRFVSLFLSCACQIVFPPALCILLQHHRRKSGLSVTGIPQLLSGTQTNQILRGPQE